MAQRAAVEAWSCGWIPETLQRQTWQDSLMVGVLVMRESRVMSVLWTEQQKGWHWRLLGGRGLAGKWEAAVESVWGILSLRRSLDIQLESSGEDL